MAASTASTSLTDHERWMIQRARELAREARTGGIPEQLAAELLVQLADLAERLGGAQDQPPLLCAACLTEACAAGNLMCDAARTASLTFRSAARRAGTPPAGQR